MNNISKKYIILGLIILIAVVLFSTSVYTVREDEVVVLHRFGKVNRVIINATDQQMVENGFENRNMSVKINVKKGLNFKFPFIEIIQKYPSKYLTYVSTPTTVNTFDRRRIELSTYAQYRVINPALFNMTLGAINNSSKLMDDRVYPAVIQTANTLKFNEFFDRDRVTEALDGKRIELNGILEIQFGLHIVDIGIYRKNFPQANIASIEEKMTQEIQKESEKLVAEGDSLLKQSKAETDRMRQELIAAAVEQSASLKAKADAGALSIYEKALRLDVEFYRFFTRMESYKNLKDTTVFLDENNDFINYLNHN